LIFLTDENFPEDGARLVQAFDKSNVIIPFLEKFQRGEKDIDWIPKAGLWNPRPIIVSGDGRILTNKVERAALKGSECTYVYLRSGWNEIQWETFAVKIIRVWPKITNAASAARQGSLIEVTTAEKVNLSFL
jgi:hypothetical protein